jgi:hypothetical protein
MLVELMNCTTLTGTPVDVSVRFVTVLVTVVLGRGKRQRAFYTHRGQRWLHDRTKAMVPCDLRPGPTWTYVRVPVRVTALRSTNLGQAVGSGALSRINLHQRSD